ncbi:hypothetical protein D3C81_1624260 [compost metagenome]
MPEYAAARQFFRRRLTAHPAQAALGQLHAIFLAPRAEAVGRGANGRAHTSNVLWMNAREDRLGVEQQHVRLQFVDLADAVAGVDHAEAPIEFHLELINASGHVRAEFLQQHIPRRQHLVHALALGDVDADR